MTVGGFNPLKKYESLMTIFPKDRGEHAKIIETTN